MPDKPPDANAAADLAGQDQALRRRAEAIVRAGTAQPLAGLSLEDTQQVLHELQVHQIELEMQNDELRRTQAELVVSQARYFDLYNLAPVGYVALSENGLILEANLTAANLLGVARNALVKQPLSRYIVPDDQDMYYRYHKHLLEQDAPLDFELRLTRAGGPPFWARVEAAPAQDADGAVRCRAVITDITQRKWAEESVRRLNAELEQRVEARTAELQATNKHLVSAMRTKDEFLATMSHELRTPLSAIMSLAELLEMELYGPLTEKQRLYTQTIFQSGQHLLTLINDLLDLAKVSAGRVQLDLGRVGVAEICQTALKLLQPQADKKLINVSLALDPAVTHVRADSRRLKQMLVILLDNAVKFSPPGSQVGLTVAGDEKQHNVEFTVWDTGIGIAAEDLPRLFADFVQLDSRLAREYEGTGQGLAMVRRLAELHGGRVKAESGGLGKGSRFTVILPFDWEDEDHLKPPAEIS